MDNQQLLHMKPTLLPRWG